MTSISIIHCLVKWLKYFGTPLLNILAGMSIDEDILHELEQELDNDTHLNSVNFFYFISHPAFVIKLILIQSKVI